ncbi:high-temperature-induced dauer-formation protein-domain-containing protein [Cyathus striatus]|nr:high-temperature-induced dauer-formation protein-domain-containing protein [Cyathus striatus]
MFSKIPQRLTAPFGLLGDEAKLAFPSQPGGILKLVTVRNISLTDSYWDQYFVLFDSASDVFSLITPHHIRRALLDAPENVATLIRVVTSRLFNLISDHTFPSSPASTSVTAFASSIIKAGSSERNTTKEVLNCLRILQRVLPVIYEVEGESYAFELELLWKKEEQEGGMTDEPQFVIEDEDDKDSEHGDTAPHSPLPSVPGNKLKRHLPSLGERLFSSLVDLLFCCGFTLPTKIQVDHYKINYVIWEKGVGSAADPGPSYPYDSNKTEVLRLLLVLLSRQIYVPPGSLFTKPSLYSLHVVQKTPRRDVLTLLCSLLNTAMNSRPSAESGISGITGKLPYNHLVFKGEDSRTNLVTMCLQVLCVLFDFQSGFAKDQMSTDGEVPLPTARTNAFRYFLMKLHRTQDLEFILKGIKNIMEQHAATSNNLLPGAKKSIPYIPETVIFFWKMIELNKKFRSHVLESDMGIDLVAHFLCYFLEIKDKPQQHGVCRAISYIVQTLSAEASFGLKLSHPIKIPLPAKWNFGGTAADFLIMAIYSIVATTSGALNSLYPALIIALSNASPYFKNLSVPGSTRLIQLLTSFSNPVFLLSDEGNPRLLFFMLEVFNSVVFHQFSSNPNVIYGILSSHKVFEDLGTFTLARGLREIRRVQLAKEEQARKQNLVKGKSSEENNDPGTEKARLLESEGQDRKASASNNVDAETRSSQGNDTNLSQDSTLTTSLMSPTEEHANSPDSTPSLSEKARGKMRERRSSSTDMSASLEHIASTGIGRNGFIPTQEWVTSWQRGLPLDPVMLVISELLPKVQEIQSSRKANSTSAVMDFLSTATLSHVLPTTPPLNPRKFVWSDASIVWLTSLIWGEIYVRNMSPLGIWNATNVRLFYVKHSHPQQRQITEAVSNVVGGLLRRTSDSQARART